MLNICEVFPIRKNLIRNIVQTPIISVIITTPVPIEAGKIQPGRAGMRQMGSHIGGRPHMAL